MAEKKKSSRGFTAEEKAAMRERAREVKGGKVVCFFQPAQKFKSRYSTLGFSDQANLDDGSLWPVAFALERLTAADEKRIRALVKQAVS